jgi:hypothetical protein
LFTKYWENVFKSQGCTIPRFNLPHGFNSDHIVKIPKEKIGINALYLNRKENPNADIYSLRGLPRYL